MTGPHVTAPLPVRPAQAVTLHQRIREDLRARIVSGRYAPHDRLPSESALMSHYGVSRITVRQALGVLQNEQLIFTVPGKGTFVTQPKPFQELGRLQGFAEAMGALGHETHNELLGINPVAAPPQVAASLRLAAGTTVTELQRVRYLDGQPVSLDITWVPQPIGERLEREDLVTRDIFGILENDYRIPLGHADLAIDATLADARQASLLGVPVGAPVLRVERLTHNRDGLPIDYEHLHCRTDNFQYRLQIARNGSGASFSCPSCLTRGVPA